MPVWSAQPKAWLSDLRWQIIRGQISPKMYLLHCISMAQRDASASMCYLVGLLRSAQTWVFHILMSS